MLGIVGIIVDGRHRGELVEPFDEHTFGIKIGETHRPDEFVALVFTRPSLSSIEQSAAHLKIIDEIDPSEARAVGIPCPIGFVVDQARHASHNLPISVSQEQFGFAKFVRPVLLGIERVEHILVEIGHRVGVVLVEVVVKTNKGFQVCLRRYFFDFYCHDGIMGCEDFRKRRFSLRSLSQKAKHANESQVLPLIADERAKLLIFCRKGCKNTRFYGSFCRKGHLSGAKVKIRVSLSGPDFPRLHSRVGCGGVGVLPTIRAAVADCAFRLGDLSGGAGRPR